MPSGFFSCSGLLMAGSLARLGGLGEQLLELLVALGQAGFHAGLPHTIARLLGGIDTVGPQPAAPVAEVLEGEELDADHIRVAAELEGLDGEVVFADGV